MYLEGRSITGVPPDRITSLGLFRTFQTARVFPQLSVLDNVLVGGYRLGRAGYAAQALRLPHCCREEQVLEARARQLLGSWGWPSGPKSARRSCRSPRRSTWSWPVADVEPRVVLFDEPGAGMNDAETEELGMILRAIRDTGHTVLVVEHNMAWSWGCRTRWWSWTPDGSSPPGRRRDPEQPGSDPRVLRNRGGERLMLELAGIHAGYENRDVLHGLSFSVPPGTIVAVVGVNGAGKSTTLKVISGLLKARRGTLSVDGRPLRGGSAGEAVRAGVVHVPEGRQVFPDMTVRENLQLGGYSVGASRLPRRLDEVLGVFPELSGRLAAYAGSLSGGQQQMLAIGRGLMSDPRYILLDEPSLGLAPQVITRIFEVIVTLKDAGKGVLLVEQNGQLALRIAQQAFLLEGGTITLTGTGAELLANSEVIDRYLGVGTAAADSARQQDWTRALRRALATRS